LWPLDDTYFISFVISEVTKQQSANNEVTVTLGVTLYAHAVDDGDNLDNDGLCHC